MALTAEWGNTKGIFQLIGYLNSWFLAAELFVAFTKQKWGEKRRLLSPMLFYSKRKFKGITGFKAPFSFSKERWF